MEFPKWVKRAEHIGAVLCLNAEEEATLLKDWAESEAARLKEEALAKKQSAQDDLEAAQLALKQAQAAAKAAA